MEGERLLLLFVVHVEGVVVFAELMVHERVGGEHVRGKPGAVQPVAMVGPFEEAGLSDHDQNRRGYEKQKKDGASRLR